MEAITDLSGFTLVPTERLRELEALEAEISKKKTAEEHDADRFKMLRERDKANPEKHVQRTMNWYEKNKESINAKRREKRRLEKETRETKTPGVGRAQTATE